jgi:hypothetical protein
MVIDVGQDLPPGWRPNPLTGIPEPIPPDGSAAPTPADARTAAIAAAETAGSDGPVRPAPEPVSIELTPDE